MVLINKIFTDRKNTPILQLSAVIFFYLLLIPLNLYSAEEPDAEPVNLKYEFEAGIGYGILNYQIDTAAHSLLKWRDSKNFQQHASFRYNFTERVHAGARFENYILSGGEMTDDDLNNFYGTNAGIFNTTRSMKGSGYKFEINSGYLFFLAGKTDFTGTFGLFIRKYKIKPKGVLQVGVYPDPDPDPDYWVYYSDQNTQHTEVTYRGFYIGSNIVYNSSETSKFLFEFKLNVPLLYDSEQYYWGYNAPDYDWKLEQNSPLRTCGIDLKIENRFSIQGRFRWGVFACYSYLKSVNQKEIDWNGSYYEQIGYAHDSVLTMIGGGVSLFF